MTHHPGTTALAMAAAAGLWLGACGGTSAPTTAPDPGDAGAAVEEPTAAQGTPGVATDEQPAAATAEEVASICRVYRTALRGRWDDQRTREEIRGLPLHSAMATAWQSDLVEGAAARSLAASRAVVDAARQQDLVSACEPLEGLVSLAESMQSAPEVFEP